MKPKRRYIDALQMKGRETKDSLELADTETGFQSWVHPGAPGRFCTNRSRQKHPGAPGRRHSGSSRAL